MFNLGIEFAQNLGGKSCKKCKDFTVCADCRGKCVWLVMFADGRCREFVIAFNARC